VVFRAELLLQLSGAPSRQRLPENDGDDGHDGNRDQNPHPRGHHIPPLKSDAAAFVLLPPSSQRVPAAAGYAYPGSARGRCCTVSVQAPRKPQAVRGAQTSGEKVARSTGFEWLARSGFV